MKKNGLVLSKFTEKEAAMLSRAECLKYLAEKVTDELVVCTIGIIGFEWSYYSGGRPCMFDSGAMGLASSIGLGLALGRPDRKVVVLDGDGALLMNLGSLATIAEQHPPNLVHLVFQNEVYESSGGQPLVNVGRVDFASIARGAGIANACNIEDMEDYKGKVEQFLKARELNFAALKVSPAERLKVSMERDYLLAKIKFMEAVRA